MRAARMNGNSKRIAALPAGGEITLAYGTDRDPTKFYNAIHKMVSRLRKKGASAKCVKIPGGMKVMRFDSVPLTTGNKKGPLRMQLEAMKRGEVKTFVYSGDTEGDRLFRLKLLRNRQEAQRMNGSVYRVTTLPDGLKVERRA